MVLFRRTDECIAQFELSIRTFWVGLAPSQSSAAQHPVMANLIYRADALVYDEILGHLHAHTLVPMPATAFSSLRSLADNMEHVIIAALSSLSGAFVGPKIELAARFGHLILRHLGICQLVGVLSSFFIRPFRLLWTECSLGRTANNRR